MGWAPNFLNRIFDQQEKLSPAEAEEAARKIRTQKRAEIKRLEDERRQNIRDKAENFRLPGGKGSSSSYNSNGELEYSNDKIKQVREKEIEKFRKWIRSQDQGTNDEFFQKALETGKPRDLKEEDFKKWEIYDLLNPTFPPKELPPFRLRAKPTAKSTGIAASVRDGKRGGKYYLKRNKKGESYRKYF